LYRLFPAKLAAVPSSREQARGSAVLGCEPANLWAKDSTLHHSRLLDRLRLNWPANALRSRIFGGEDTGKYSMRHVNLGFLFVKSSLPEKVL
jgi:hypothetical protein